MTDHVDWYLVDYLQGKLSSSKRRFVSDHLIDCVRCQNEYQQYQKLMESLQSLPEIKPSRSFTKEVLEQVNEVSLAETKADLVLEEIIDMKKSPPRPLLPWVLVGILLIVLGGVLVFKIPLEPLSLLPSEDIFSSVSKIEQTNSRVVTEENRTSQILDQPPGEIVPSVLPEKLTQTVMADLILEYEVASLDLQEEESLVAPAFTSNIIKDSKPLELPNRREVQSLKFENPIEGEYRLPDSLLAHQPQKNVDVSSVNYRSPHWAIPLIGDQGQVGKGNYFSVAFNSLLAGEVAVGIPDIFPRDRLKKVFSYIDQLSLENGISRNVYYHAQFTYHLANLVKLGHQEGFSQLVKACEHLVKIQNADGGWGFFYEPQSSPSNALVSGWASLALSDASYLGVPKLKGVLEKSRGFFHRLTDPRSAECGFFARGDHREPHLCSMFSSLVRLTRVSAKKIPQTIRRTTDWVESGMSLQRLNINKWTDYDFLLMSQRFLKDSDSRLKWSDLLGSLWDHPERIQQESRWGTFSPVSNQLLKDLLLQNQ